MTSLVDNITPFSLPKLSDMTLWAEAINQATKNFSEKDWNYSRIKLIIYNLEQLTSPYVLNIDWLDLRGKQGQKEYKSCLDEVTWGKRHSNELGILEMISLRLNDALAETTTPEYWHGIRPVIRLQKSTELLKKGQTHAFWYDVEEIQGEEFENR